MFLSDLVRTVLRPTGLDVLGFSPEPFRNDALLSDFSLRRHLGGVLAWHQIDTVLDVGANRGQYARLLRRVGFEGRICSFEPVHELAEGLRATATADSRWEVYGYALGREEARRALRVFRGSEFSSFAEPTAYARAVFPTFVEEAHTETVEIRRLDAVLPAILEGASDPRVLLKVDTQGHDRAVLEGAGAWLGRVRALQVELSFQALYEDGTSASEMLAWLAALGFVPTALVPVARDPHSMALIEADGLFVRATG